MGRGTGSALALGLVVLVLALEGADAELAVPALQARVNDHARVLTPAQAAALESELAALEQETTHQIAVLTVPSLEGDPIEDFAIRVADAWKLGREDADNGILLLVAPNDRQVRIEVGRGLEGVVPDAIASRIIRNEMIPRFQANDLAGGIAAGVAALAAAARGERVSLPEEPPRGWGGAGPSPLAIVLFASLFGALWSTPFRKRRPLAAGVGGGIAGLLTFVVLGAVTGWILLACVGGALCGLFLPVARGRGLPRGGPVSGWGGGRSGGGGFGGGGGSFGGGGASGRW